MLPSNVKRNLPGLHFAFNPTYHLGSFLCNAVFKKKNIGKFLTYLQVNETALFTFTVLGLRFIPRYKITFPDLNPLTRWQKLRFFMITYLHAFMYLGAKAKRCHGTWWRHRGPAATPRSARHAPTTWPRRSPTTSRRSSSWGATSGANLINDNAIATILFIQSTVSQ
jgi:hypothetical protein